MKAKISVRILPVGTQVLIFNYITAVGCDVFDYITAVGCGAHAGKQ